MKKFAFTLAEALITIVIIGVIAAIVVPTIIQSHRNKVVETRLVKFYRDINSAIRLSEVENGSKELWTPSNEVNYFEYDENGKPIEGTSEVEKWFKIYIAPFLNIVKITYDEKTNPVFYLADGSALTPADTVNYVDWVFFPGDPEKCKERYNNNMAEYLGVCAFGFHYRPNESEEDYYFSGWFKPFDYAWDKTKEGMWKNTAGTRGCFAGENFVNSRCYCTLAIQQSGWKIPKEYPFKVSY